MPNGRSLLSGTAKSVSEPKKTYQKSAASAISTAVAHTSQTYVDGLKKSGTSTKENQDVALQKTLEESKNLLTAEAAFLRKAYGDLDAYLISNIEAEVKTQKLFTSAA